eukprot:SAG25_NODE_4381_length_827_cov_1.458791_1_plen_59_part_10
MRKHCRIIMAHSLVTGVPVVLRGKDGPGYIWVRPVAIFRACKAPARCTATTSDMRSHVY